MRVSAELHHFPTPGPCTTSLSQLCVVNITAVALFCIVVQAKVVGVDHALPSLFVASRRGCMFQAPQCGHLGRQGSVHAASTVLRLAAAGVCTCLTLFVAVPKHVGSCVAPANLIGASRGTRATALPGVQAWQRLHRASAYTLTHTYSHLHRTGVHTPFA